MLFWTVLFTLVLDISCLCSWTTYEPALTSLDGDLRLICEVERLQDFSQSAHRELSSNPSFIERTVSVFIICTSKLSTIDTHFDTASLRRLNRLSEVSVHGCRIRTLNREFLRSLQSVPVKSLDLSRNGFENIEDSAFEVLPSLEKLTLDNNDVSVITKDSFRHLAKLVTLGLTNNNIRTIDIGAFDELMSLQTLHVDGNEITDINGVFNGLPQLRILNLSENRISLFDFSFLPPTLESLNLRRNEISEIGNYFELQGQLSLKLLDMSFNLIQSVKDLNVPNQVQNLILSHNRISEVAQNTFTEKRNLTKIDLTWNQLQHIDAASFWLSPQAKSTPELYLGNNPLICDCSLEWLPRLVNSAPSQPRLVDANEVQCELVTGHGKRPLLQVKTDEFLCPYESHCFALCHCCDFDACDCEMACPAGCNCYHDNAWANNYVQCSNTGSSVLPSNVPMDVTHLAVDGNRYGEMKSHSFIGRKNLRSLFLNSSYITGLQNRTFHGLSNLEVLHLEDNFLTEIYSWDFESLESLQEIYLQNNQIQMISSEAFSHLSNLRKLHLEGNQLTNLAEATFASNYYLAHLSLGNNPWTCGCDMATMVRSWTGNDVERLEEMSPVLCTNELGVLHSVIALAEVCNSGETLVIYSAPTMPNMVPVTIASVLAVVLLVLMAAIFIVIRRRALKSWLVSRWASEKKGNINKAALFDLCVCYSLKDEPFVTQVLSPALEQGEQPRRIHLQHRDGGSSPEETLQIAAATSHRMLIVGSNPFLETEWDRPETRNAIVTAAQNRSIVILLLDDGVDIELKKVLRDTTVLNWDDAKFWPVLNKTVPPLCRTLKKPCSSKEPCQAGAHMTCNFSQYPGVARRYTATPHPECNTLYIRPQSSEHVYMTIDDPIYHSVNNTRMTSFNKHYTMRSDYRNHICEQFCCTVPETGLRHTGQRLITQPHISEQRTESGRPAFLV